VVDKYKFRVGEKAIITADLGDVIKAAQPRRGALDYIEPEYPGRRLNEPIIIFYDLGQVNNGDLDDPVWEDHPILKTPSYTTSPQTWGIGLFAGVKYSVDPFDDDDFQAYTDRMFTYPVEDWALRYKRIEFPDDFGTDFETDVRISMRESSISFPTDDRFIEYNAIDRSALGAGYAATKQSYLTDLHRALDIDRQGEIYRALDELTVNRLPFNGFDTRVEGGYFGLSTGQKSIYKITDTYDPDAADYGTLVPHGNINVFLMPQLGFYAGTSNSADFGTTEVIGMCYQVQPRKKWPGYIGPFVTADSGNSYYDDVDVADYFSYQQGRSGMQYSVWHWTGIDDLDLSYTETPGVPADWTGQTGWATATTTARLSGFFSAFERGGPTEDNHATFDTVFEGNISDVNFGPSLFICSTPFLVAVIEMAQGFFYVWDISNTVEPIGNWSCLQTLAQGDRFRLSRGVEWNVAQIDTVPILPYDGTHVFFDT
jgi:hypothetical protein